MAIKLLSGVYQTGVSNAHDLAGTVKAHTVSVVFTDADTSITVLVVDLEGTIDGTNWYVLASHTLSAAELTALAAMFHVADKPVKKVRTNIKTITGATSADSVDVWYDNYKKY